MLQCETDLSEFEKIINYKFKNKKLLAQALCHSSYANENRKIDFDNNERLEFLGDAVLELIISDYIFRNYTSMPEGELTKFRASIVCESTLAKHALKLKIGEYIMLGKGEKCAGGNNKESILADAFEAIIGAIYLDSDTERVKKYILDNMKPTILRLKESFKTMDYKTHLQEVIQKHDRETVKYEIIKEEGPDHNKEFVAVVSHNGKNLGKGSGKTKKEAEQNAALDALNRL